jgi:pyruvate/2-oxoglutarate dehydrogenase complex dihydrolipoamide dehydrogenase (E3) component
LLPDSPTVANFDLDLFRTVPCTERSAPTADGHRARVALVEGYRVEGIHILDSDAAELIQPTAFAVRLGATKNKI